MSYIKPFLENRNKSLLGIFTLFILIAIFSMKNGIVAQVSNYVFTDGASVESPSKLEEKPSDIDSEVRQNTSEMRSQANSENENLPDYIIYAQIFRHIKELNKKADEVEKLGQDGSNFRKLYQNMAGLTNQEAEKLDTIAKTANEEISELDIQARIIITNLRAQHPDGKLAQGETPPTPPAELINLSDQRKEIIEQAISDLQTGLEGDGFAKFSTFVNEKVRPGVRTLN
jgi:hypothetical protein